MCSNFLYFYILCCLWISVKELKGAKQGYREEVARWRTSLVTSTSALGCPPVAADGLRCHRQGQRRSSPRPLGNEVIPTPILCFVQLILPCIFLLPRVLLDYDRKLFSLIYSTNCCCIGEAWRWWWPSSGEKWSFMLLQYIAVSSCLSSCCSPSHTPWIYDILGIFHGGFSLSWFHL
jgi:hypothetical protein